MKKLIAMIGAVAMSLGLFADAATPFTTSFEASDTGVSGTTYTSGDAGWTGLTDPLTLNVYGDTDPAYVYTTTRRFEGNNTQYLPLETEKSAALNHDIGEGNIFVDQLVRFTGFEDPQTNLVAGTKIAVWMGEFFNDEETEATTNLYVTVGSDKTTDQIAVKLAGTYEINKWYRLTIKSLGNIFDDQLTARAGFSIWIDGVKKAIASDDPNFENLLSDSASGHLTSAAGSAYAKSQLFPAISSGSDEVALASFGYNGIGAIDDVYVDDVGPDFTVEEYTFTIADDDRVGGADVTAGGTPLEEPYTVAPGTEVTITWAAKDGYKIRGAATQTATIESDGQVVEVDDEQVTILEVVATVTNGATVNEFVADELYGMINNLVDGDTVEFKADAAIKDGEENVLYDATEGTTIDVHVLEDNTAWLVDVAGEGASFIDNVGADENVAKAFTFDDDDGFLILGGNVAGNVTAATIEVDEGITVSGTLSATTLNDHSYEITLDGEGEIITKTDGLELLPEGKVEKIGPDAEGFYTYQIKTAPDTFTVTVPELTTGLTIASITTNNVQVSPAVPGDYILNEGETFNMLYAPADDYRFTVDTETGIREATTTTTIDPPTVGAIPYVASVLDKDGETFKYETAAAALSKVQALEAEGDFPIVATALVDDLAIVGPNGQQIVLAKDETVTINKGSWVFSSGVTIVPGTPIALAAGATFTVVGQLSTALFSAPADYRVKEINNGDGTYTYTTEAIAYVAQIGANKYETFDAAWAAARENDEIVLLADCTLGDPTSTAKIELNKNLQLTLNGYELTVGGYLGRLYVVDDAKLTVDGLVEGSQLNGTLYAGIMRKIEKVKTFFNGNIVINGGTYVAPDHNEYGLAAIQSNGGSVNSSITATGATFIGGNMSVEPTDDNRDQQGIAAVLAAGGTYTFTDCEFTGCTGIYAKAGTLTLDGCTVAANGTQFAPVANTDGSDPTGDAIIFDSNSAYNGGLTLVVTGDSSISSENGYAFQETVTKGSVSATLAVSIANTVDVDGEVVLSDAFAAAVKEGTASITGYAATVNNIAYQTVEAALAEVQALEAEEKYPITVAALAADGLTITDGANTAKIVAGVTITITKGAWAVNDTLNYAGEIDGAVTAVAIAKIGGAAITLNKNASVTITGGVVPEASFFTCGAGEGYEVKKNDNVFTVGLIQLTATFKDYDGTVLYTEENIPYNTKPTYSTEPTRTGYTFTGWNPEVAAIKVDTTYTATYEANTYDIVYTWVDDDGASVDPLANTLPMVFTFDGESIELKAEMVSLTKDYKSVAFEPATVTTDVAAPFAVTITLTKAAPEYPSDWPATDDATKAKFATWVAGKGAGADLSTDAAKSAFLLNCTVAELETEKAAFKITAFTGTKASVVTPTKNTKGDDFNGAVTVKAFEDVACKTEPVDPDDQAALFFKAFLDFPAAE